MQKFYIIIIINHWFIMKFDEHFLSSEISPIVYVE